MPSIGTGNPSPTIIISELYRILVGAGFSRPFNVVLGNVRERDGKPVPYNFARIMRNILITNYALRITNYFKTFILSIFISSVPVIEQPRSLE